MASIHKHILLKAMEIDASGTMTIAEIAEHLEVSVQQLRTEMTRLRYANKSLMSKQDRRKLDKLYDKVLRSSVPLGLKKH